MRDTVRPSSRWLPVLMFVAVATGLLLFMDVRLTPYDEGIILVGAQQVLGGNLPHRDFYANYGPGTFYPLAALFWAFGPSFLAERMLDTMWRAGCVVLAYVIVRRHTDPRPALLIAGVAAAWMWSAKFYAYPNFACLCLVLLQVWLLTGRLSARKIALIGGLTGIIFWIRYDVGAFVGISHVISLAILAPRRPEAEAQLGVALTRAVAAYAAGLALAIVPLAAYLASADVLTALMSDVLGHTLSNYSQARRLPFPGLIGVLGDPDQAGLYLPFAAIALTGAFLVGRFRQLPLPLFLACAVLLPLVALLTLKGVVRVSIVHMMLAILPATVLAGVLTGAQVSQGFRIAASTLVTLSLATSLLHSARRAKEMLPHGTERLLIGRLLSRPGPGVAASGSQSIYWLSEEERCTIDYLDRNTDRADHLFVGNGRHDKTFANRVSMYFTANRRPATHWYHFDPGVQNRADIQDQIMRDLASRHVRWVIRDRTFDNIIEPNSSAMSSGEIGLDRFIDTNYYAAVQCGVISIHARRRAST